MMPDPPATVTCPYGHSFPSSQLSVRGGQYVCPVCDGAQWASPRPGRVWSRRLLQPPMVLLAIAVLLEVGLQITSIGLGAAYADQNLTGSGWLIVNGILSLVGTAAVLVGVIAIVPPLKAASWTRRRLFVPLMVVGIGLVVTGVGGLFGIGLNVALLNASAPGANWQMAGELLDALSTLALGGVAIWIALVIRAAADQPAAAEEQLPSTT